MYGVEIMSVVRLKVHAWDFGARVDLCWSEGWCRCAEGEETHEQVDAHVLLVIV